jgi:hypothetical protein
LFHGVPGFAVGVGFGENFFIVEEVEMDFVDYSVVDAEFGPIVAYLDFYGVYVGE